MERHISFRERIGMRGVLIMMANNFEFKIHEKVIDENRRYILADIEIPDVASLLLIHLYAPNLDSPSFFTEITKKNR